VSVLLHCYYTMFVLLRGNLDSAWMTPALASTFRRITGSRPSLSTGSTGYSYGAASLRRMCPPTLNLLDLNGLCFDKRSVGMVYC